jgi:hypothetical protein
VKNLFGWEVPDVPQSKRADRAHPARPGSGPKGETCGTCRHLARIQPKVYRKCALMRHLWTSSYGTDVRCKDWACERWEGKADA